jgi:hypothetical protein
MQLVTDHCKKFFGTAGGAVQGLFKKLLLRGHRLKIFNFSLPEKTDDFFLVINQNFFLVSPNFLPRSLPFSRYSTSSFFKNLFMWSGM